MLYHHVQYHLSTVVTGGSSDTFGNYIYRGNMHLHIPPGTMSAYVTDAGALWTGFNPVTEDALSVDEFQLQNTVKIITNPESLTITSTNNLQLNSYTLYTVTGAKIHTGKSSEISTSTMSKGVYILKLDFNQGTLVKKVIIN
ncbi:T9SS type A sorting domain-containing protein [Corallibacter sp.]|uniref:T9SS type A sorting domain-containing protein n=1 Tax=Corallibacter sp. TaxID=2038084 RepID=UPI003A936FE9